MTKWSDAELTLTVPEADLSQADEIHVTIAQGDRYAVDIEVDPAEVVGQHDLQVRLTQRQTSGFRLNPPTTEIQVNFMVGGIRKATEIVSVPVKDNLLRKVIGNE